MELITSELLFGETVSLTPKRKEEIYTVFKHFASEGKRVLAMAYRDFTKSEE